MRGALLALAALVLLPACAPLPVAQAEDLCLREVRSRAGGPRGEVAVGLGSGGPRTRVSLSLSTDSFAGRDPAEIYDRCVYSKSGRLPTRPLLSRPDWKG